MKKKIIFGLIASLSCISLIKAQFGLNNTSGVSYVGDASVKIYSNNGGKFLTFDEIKGSPYQTPDFVDAVVSTTNGTVNKPIRYNSYKDEIEFEKDDKIYFMDKNQNFLNAVIPSLKQKLILIETKDDNNGFFYILADGTYALVKKVKTKFVDEIKARTTYDNNTPAKFQTGAPQYFIYVNQKLSTVPKNLKNLFEITGKNDEIEKFVKDNNIKFSKEEDLIKLTNFLNKK